MKHCESKLGEEKLKRLLESFASDGFSGLYEEEETTENSAGAESAKTVGMYLFRDLLSKTLIPSVDSEFQSIWTLLPEAKRKKILTTDSKALVNICEEAFAKVNKMYLRFLEKLFTNQGAEDDLSSGDNCNYKQKTEDQSEPSNEPKQNGEKDDDIPDVPDVCSDDSCPCKDPKKLYQHFVAILASENNPVPFYKCASTGDVIMMEEMCLDKDGKNVGRMVAFDFDHVNTTMNSIEKEKFSSCARLALLCKRVCHNIYPLIIKSLCQSFVELQEKDSSEILLQICPACGKIEPKPGKFKRCGGCKKICYCGRKCQVRDWKAGHKQKCIHSFIKECEETLKQGS